MKNKLYTETEFLDDLKWRTRLVSQKSVAEQLGISGAYLSDILNGRRDISSMVAAKLGYRKVVNYEKEK